MATKKTNHPESRKKGGNTKKGQDGWVTLTGKAGMPGRNSNGTRRIGITIASDQINRDDLAELVLGARLELVMEFAFEEAGGQQLMECTKPINDPLQTMADIRRTAETPTEFSFSMTLPADITANEIDAYAGEYVKLALRRTGDIEGGEEIVTED